MILHVFLSVFLQYQSSLSMFIYPYLPSLLAWNSFEYSRGFMCELESIYPDWAAPKSESAESPWKSWKLDRCLQVDRASTSFLLRHAWKLTEFPIFLSAPRPWWLDPSVLSIHARVLLWPLPGIELVQTWMYWYLSSSSSLGRSNQVTKKELKTPHGFPLFLAFFPQPWYNWFWLPLDWWNKKVWWTLNILV